MTQPIISRILLTFICLVTITISGQQPDVCSRFTYKFTYQPDSTDVQSKRQLLFYFLQKNDSTLFTQVENKRADSLEHLIWEQYKQSKNGSSLNYKGVPDAAFKYYILKNLSSQNEPVTVIDKVRTTNYQNPDSANFSWNIFPDTKVIAGFPVQKAETYAYGRKFTALFSAEIPISDGPYTFRGLPGLILEIYEPRNILRLPYRNASV